MTLFAALCAGAGSYLIWLACWKTDKKPKRRPEPRIALLLKQAGITKVSTRLFYLLSLGTGTIVAVIILALTGLYNLSLILGVAGCLVPRFYIGQRAKKRNAAIRDLWPDVVDHLRSAIRAGLSLPEALLQLQYRGPEQLRPAFEDFAADYRSTGEFVASLNRLKDRLADPTADNIIEALKVTREVGGTDLGRLLGTLSEFLRENARTRSELEARQSWTINAAKLAVCAPWTVLCLMATQPGTVKVYNSMTGMMVMLGGLVISLVAYRIMLFVGALPEGKRVLA